MELVSNLTINNDLINASYNGFSETVRELILKGANINFKNNYGDNSLILASYKGHVEIVKA